MLDGQQAEDNAAEQLINEEEERQHERRLNEVRVIIVHLMYT